MDVLKTETGNMISVPGLGIPQQGNFLAVSPKQQELEFIGNPEQISALILSLAKATLKFDPVVRNQENDYTKKKYADLAEILKATRRPLAEEGLVIIQGPATSSTHEIVVVTFLAHVSGGYVKSRLPIPSTAQKPQEVGAVITYLRRYAESALLNIAAEDEDGPEHDEKTVQIERPAAPPPAKTSEPRPAGKRGRPAATSEPVTTQTTPVPSQSEPVIASADLTYTAMPTLEEKRQYGTRLRAYGLDETSFDKAKTFFSKVAKVEAIVDVPKEAWESGFKQLDAANTTGGKEAVVKLIASVVG